MSPVFIFKESYTIEVKDSDDIYFEVLEQILDDCKQHDEEYSKMIVEDYIPKDSKLYTKIIRSWD